MSVVIDASVVCKVLFGQPGSDTAQQMIASEELVVPDLLFAEVANVAWKYVRFQALDLADARRAMRQLLDIPFTLADSRPVLADVLAIAVEFQRSAYDSTYLAIARARGIEMVTADLRLVAALRGTSLASYVRVLDQ